MMNRASATAVIHYDDRGEAIKYRLENRSLTAFCTQRNGPRLYANSVKEWKVPPSVLSNEERLCVLKDMLEWMARPGPGFIRRLFGLGPRTAKLVVDEMDSMHPLLESIPAQLKSSGIHIAIEHDSFQKRRDAFDAVVIPMLKQGRGSITIHGKKITTLEEFLAIEDRHTGISVGRFAQKRKSR